MKKINRQGHSNIKKSYWAIGYDTLQDFYEMSKKEDIDKYKEIHNNCCGLGVPENRIKNIKKAQRKIKLEKELNESRIQCETYKNALNNTVINKMKYNKKTSFDDDDNFSESENFRKLNNEFSI